MDGKTLWSLVDDERARWDDALTRIDPATTLQPGVVGDWSVKDLIAHVTWYDREMADLLDRHSLDGASPLWDQATDDRNAVIYAENRDRELADVSAEADAVFARLRVSLVTLSAADLKDPSRFDMPSDWKPWDIIAQNTFEHYQHHRPHLEAWILSCLR